MQEKVMHLMIAQTQAEVHYYMEGQKPHVTRVIASDGRILSKLSDTYSPSLELMVLLEEGLLKEEQFK